MERFLKVALELLKEFLFVIMKLESSFIKFLLNQATIWHKKNSRDCDRTECSTGVFGSRILLKIWRLHLPKKKIKVFMWRACKNILPTHVNSMKRRVISEETCEACKQFPDTSLHLLWVCNVAQDVWASYSVWLRKCVQGQ